MGRENTTQTVHNPDIIAPPPGTEGGGERVGTWEEAREEDGHPGGGWQTESMGVTKEGGARADQTETGGTWSRWSPVGPRPQP